MSDARIRANLLSPWSLAPGLIVRRHVLKNGLIVVVTLLGIQVGQLLGGAVVVEEIFSIPGVGYYIFDRPGLEWNINTAHALSAR